jgi:DNA-binding transcriptional LysR family regulator
VRVAQPALSKQIHDLETELGVTLFDRLPQGVRLTRVGEAFLAQARNTLDPARRAVASARGAAKDGAADLAFAHGEVAVYAAVIEDLLGAFRKSHPRRRCECRT